MKALPPDNCHLKPNNGFTLIELVIALALIAFLVGISVFVIDPGRRLAEARNDERTLSINIILNAIGQNIADNTGTFNCAAGSIPTTTTIMGNATSSYDIRDCIVPAYLSEIPVDPVTGVAPVTGTSTYDTRYSIAQDATTTRITVTAPDAELGEAISTTR